MCTNKCWQIVKLQPHPIPHHAVACSRAWKHTLHSMMSWQSGGLQEVFCSLLLHRYLYGIYCRSPWRYTSYIGTGCKEGIRIMVYTRATGNHLLPLPFTTAVPKSIPNSPALQLSTPHDANFSRQTAWRPQLWCCCDFAMCSCLCTGPFATEGVSSHRIGL